MHAFKARVTNRERLVSTILPSKKKCSIFKTETDSLSFIKFQDKKPEEKKIDLTIESRGIEE